MRDAALVPGDGSIGGVIDALALAEARVPRRSEGRAEPTPVFEHCGDRADPGGDRRGGTVQQAMGREDRLHALVRAHQRLVRSGRRIVERDDREAGVTQGSSVAPAAGREVENPASAFATQALDEALGKRVRNHSLPSSEKGSQMLGEGDRLPAITLLDDQGNPIDTGDLLGGPLVLYFYPKDDTPGCTSEASQFRDLYAQFQKKNARIVGVSRDSVESHQRFKKKYSIPFALLADVDSQLYDALGVKARSTFLIDGSGRIERVWPKVNVEEHAEEVLAALP
jgi:thioredoxin-dependent peroxiredoxin